jgi:hypothetical protein
VILHPKQPGGHESGVTAHGYPAAFAIESTSTRAGLIPAAAANDLAMATWGSAASSFQEYIHPICSQIWCEVDERQHKATSDDATEPFWPPAAAGPWAS